MFGIPSKYTTFKSENTLVIPSILVMVAIIGPIIKLPMHSSTIIIMKLKINNIENFLIYLDNIIDMFVMNIPYKDNISKYRKINGYGLKVSMNLCPKLNDEPTELYSKF